MKRAAVLIGVERTGGLPRLHDAVEGARKIYDWAKANDIDAHLITDADGPVRRQAIFDKIVELNEDGNIDQLLIYFGGHGVNLRYSEYWLLSDAPIDGSAAVNVATSAELARRCGIPHVVLVSDACRTAAEGIQAESIEGAAIFPNVEPTGTEKAVDLFFATVLGSPALEIKDKADSAQRYKAIYTTELHRGLEGRYPEYLTPGPQGNQFLRPRPLKKLLAAKVPARVSAMVGSAGSQTPDARITSDDDVWLASFEARFRWIPTALESFAPPAAVAPSIAVTVDEAIRTAFAVGATTAVADLLKSDRPGAKELAATIQEEAVPAGPVHVEMRCGFKIRGAKVAAAFAASGDAEVVEPTLVSVDSGDRATNVLLEFTDGRAVLLPVIKDFLATLTFAGRELQNVAYEPSALSARWHNYLVVRDELTALRSLIASSAVAGGFRLDRDDAPKLTERIRNLKSIDPTMALYAAYSYHNLGRRDRIRAMQQYLHDDLDIKLFDVAMLAGDRLPRRSRDERLFPFAPLLSQGWSLLDAFAAPLPGRLSEFKRHVGMSLWTVYEPPALPILQSELRG